MSASSDRTLRFVSGAAALVVFTFVLPLVQPGALKANDVLFTVKDLGAECSWRCGGPHILALRLTTTSAVRLSQRHHDDD